MAMNQMRTFDELINVLQLQAANLTIYMADVGATLADITAVQDMLANLTAVQDFAEVIDADKKTIIGIKQMMFNGTVGETVPAVPPIAPLVIPSAPLLSGCREITLKQNKRFMLGPGYTPVIGEALGIEAPTPDPIVPGTVKPDIEAFPAAINYQFSLVVSKRAGSTMWDAYILRKGAANWVKLGSAEGKSSDFTITPTTPGDAEQFQVRVQLRKNNADYGQPSDPTFVTVNP